MPEAFTAKTRVLPLDDTAAVTELFAREGADIAAVIIEPVPANHGLLPQRREFLECLRALTRAHGALLIFDEVICGLRLARGGAAELLGIPPDLASVRGKVIGGGVPVGAFGGARALMSPLAPLGDTYQAGTLSGNPVAMAAASPRSRSSSARTAGRGSRRSGPSSRGCSSRCSRARPFPCTWCGRLALLAVPERGRRAARGRHAQRNRARALRPAFHGMLTRGVCLPPSAYEACFLSLAHSRADLEQFAAALAESLGAAASGRCASFS